MSSVTFAVMDKIGVADVAQLEADLLLEALDASPQ